MRDLENAFDERVVLRKHVTTSRLKSNIPGLKRRSGEVHRLRS